MAKIEITKDTNLQSGSIVEIDFDFLFGNNTLLKAGQIYWLEQQAKQNYSRWTYISNQTFEDHITMRFKVIPDASNVGQVQEAGVTGAIIAAAVLGASIFTYFSFRSIYLIVGEIGDTPGGQAMIAGVGVATIALSALIIWYVLKTFKIVGAN